VYCGIGLRAYLAQRILLGNGFTNVRNLIGGSSLYETATANYSPKKQTPNNAHMASTINTPNFEIKTMQIDTCGLQCPGPILKVKQAADKMQAGERVEIIATDPGFARDIQAWCNTTGNRLVSQTSEKGRYSATIEKQDAQACKIMTSCDSKAKTFIMFSDDLDKALATFVLANGAAATGQKVTIFFTFWGLNVIKKQKKGRVEKDIWGKMFGFMLPAHSLKLKLSKMNMGGMGTQMMRYLMKLKNIDSLEQMRQSALDQGVEFIACQMSMDMMGVKREELMDEVTIGGVATYMERADQANINLFI
jgi:peroxiredoxin family protein/TusA-related sulfurtransferase